MNMETIFEKNYKPGPKGCNNNSNMLMDAKTLLISEQF